MVNKSDIYCNSLTFIQKAYLIFYEEKIKIKVNTVPEGGDEFFYKI